MHFGSWPGVAENAIELFGNNPVTLTGAIFETLPVQNSEIAAAVRDESRVLKHARRGGNGADDGYHGVEREIDVLDVLIDFVENGPGLGRHASPLQIRKKTLSMCRHIRETQSRHVDTIDQYVSSS